MSTELVEERLSLGDHAGVLVDLLNENVDEVYKRGMCKFTAKRIEIRDEAPSAYIRQVGTRKKIRSTTTISLKGYELTDYEKSLLNGKEYGDFRPAQDHPLFLDLFYEYFMCNILDGSERTKLANVFQYLEPKKYDWVYHTKRLGVERSEEDIDLQVFDDIEIKLKSFLKEFRSISKFNENLRLQFHDLFENILIKMCLRLSTLKSQLQNE